MERNPSLSIDSHELRLPNGIDSILENVRNGVEAKTAAALKDSDIAITLGGDHSISLGSVAGTATTATGDMGLLWIDAHADLNTFDTSPSGNPHGMVIAGLLGDIDTHPEWHVPALREENIVYIGVRDVDRPEEYRRLRDSAATVFTASDIERWGFEEVVQRAARIATTDVSTLHVSLDIDVFDPLIAPGTGTPVEGGLTEREGHHLLSFLAESESVQSTLRGLDIVEVDPTIANSGETATLAARLLNTFVQKRSFPDQPLYR